MLGLGLQPALEQVSHGFVYWNAEMGVLYSKPLWVPVVELHYPSGKEDFRGLYMFIYAELPYLQFITVDPYDIHCQ